MWIELFKKEALEYYWRNYLENIHIMYINYGIPFLENIPSWSENNDQPSDVTIMKMEHFNDPENFQSSEQNEKFIWMKPFMKMYNHQSKA